MAAETLDTDYLVIGAGAMGVAFADEVLGSDPAAQIVMVDRHARAGGHWNDAYSYVKLHQPAAFYGVNSENLGPGGAALVSGTEVLGYYERVLANLVATGRLHFYPMCLSDGKASFRSLVEDGLEYRVEVRRKIVDATYMKVEVPSIRPPLYDVDEAVSLVPPNELPKVSEPRSGYAVIGAGKTGIDAVLFLLDQAVDPDRIRWIMPNDPWLLDRGQIVPGRISEGAALRMKAFAESETLEEVMQHLEGGQSVLRLDEKIWPKNYRCATVNREEFEKLQRVKNIVRLGRVKRIEGQAIVLEEGNVPTDAGWLYVDCTADGLAKRNPRPVFEGNRITLQSLMMCQQVFSAAVIGHVETRYPDEAAKNALCRPVPHPNVARDFVLATLLTDLNAEAWMKAFPRWLFKSRLSMFSQDGYARFFLETFRIRKIVGPARESVVKIFQQEFPDVEVPSA